MNKIIIIEHPPCSSISFNVHASGYCVVDSEDYDIPINNLTPFYRLILMTKGSVKIFDNINTEYTLKTHDVALIKPNVKNTYTQKAPSEDYWINFYGTEKITEELGLSDKDILITHLGAESCAKLQSVIDDIITQTQLKQFGYQISCAEKLLKALSLVASVVKGNNISIGGGKMNKIKPALIEMNNNYQTTESMDHYSNLCNMSKSSFMHNFSKLMHTTPVKYINSIKLLNAKSLLAESGMTVSEISDILGFSSPLYFSDLFKREFGVRPTEYRKTKKQS